MPTHQRERSSLSRSNPSPNNNNPREKRVVEVVEPQIIKTKSYKYANIMDVDQKRKQGNGGEDMSINFIKSRKRNPPDTSLAAISKPLAATSKVTTTRAVRESAPSPSPKLTRKNQELTTKGRETDNNNKSPDRKSAKKRRFKWMHSGNNNNKSKTAALATNVVDASSSEDTISEQSSVASTNPSDTCDTAASTDAMSARSDYSQFSDKRLKRNKIPSEERQSRNAPANPVNMIYLKFHEGRSSPRRQRRDKDISCYVTPKPKDPPFRTRGIQTMYRESSTQTLPYLPDVANNPADLVDMELFKLKDILPGDGPPGLYEVEILERERKRWAFLDSLRERVQQSRGQIRMHEELLRHKDVLERFEWHRWLHREEYLQECQLMRLEIVVAMFNKREKSMHTASKKRIETSYVEINRRRRRDLRKNAVELARIIRVVEMQRRKQSRVWRKESIIDSLSSPTSEFYAPMIRYGVNPNRRHFKGDSKGGFNESIQTLNNTSIMHIDPRNLECPFAKLKTWAKPKAQVYEVEQKFCSETKLQALYENLRSLRVGLQRVKVTPKCLKERQLHEMEMKTDSEFVDGVSVKGGGLQSDHDNSSDYLESSEEGKDESSSFSDEVYMTNISFSGQRKSSIHFNIPPPSSSMDGEQRVPETGIIKRIQDELRHEEIEALIDSFEGISIGWLMNFLADEMIRLKEQRRLHFFTLLAKQERWHREAREAGLRQKENYIRSQYEAIYNQAQEANLETTKKYVDEILAVEMDNYAVIEAEDFVEDVARVVDQEVEGWIESFNEIQTPLNYMSLRLHLRDIVIPDTERMLANLQRDADIRYIIDEVLMPEVFKGLESFDIGTMVASHLVDRLIDNDLYIISTEESSDEDTVIFPELHEAQKEAHAILRKMIRQSVPGRRWLTPQEREEHEEMQDILNMLMGRIQRLSDEKSRSVVIKDTRFLEEMESEDFDIMPEVYDFLADLMNKSEERMNVMNSISSHDDDDSSKIDLPQQLTDSLFQPPPSSKPDSIIKDLKSDEILLLLDPDNISLDHDILEMVQYTSPDSDQYRLNGSMEVDDIPNTHSMHLSTRFSSLQQYVSMHYPDSDPNRSSSHFVTETTTTTPSEVLVNQIIDNLLEDIIIEVHELNVYEEYEEGEEHFEASYDQDLYDDDDDDDHDDDDDDDDDDDGDGDGNRKQRGLVTVIIKQKSDDEEDDELAYSSRSEKSIVSGTDKKPSLGLRLLDVGSDLDDDDYERRISKDRVESSTPTNSNLNTN